MIAARRSETSGFAARLALRAAQIAAAATESALYARNGDPRRWRQARLLWPLFSSRPERD
ncbi:hypothetical protein [Alteraurantiacibacter palmitatis]|uniref:Uncharacterized protein n=1 Tax=Alteraurantiacibacter palmitatis TaxID=2054628 RepID=A0ABV7E8C4_9SPHN